MIWLLTRTVAWPVKAGAYGAAAGYRTGRLLGWRRLTVFGLGVGVGLLVAPVTGRELRRRLQERFGSGVMGELPAAGETTVGAVPVGSPGWEPARRV